MGVLPSNQVAASIRGTDGSDGFPNMAGHEDPDAILIAELEAAGICHYSAEWLRKDKSEVKAGVRGMLDPSGWGFHRAWYYWVADGPGIPPEDAQKLYDEFGAEVRIQGHCGCPGPGYCMGFAVGSYHADTPRGLKALADTIKGILARNGHEVVPLPVTASMESGRQEEGTDDGG